MRRASPPATRPSRRRSPAWDRWDAAHLPDHRLVAELDGAVVGWTAVSAVLGRCVYAGVVEHSVYVAETARGRGVGHRLLAASPVESEAASVLRA